MARIPSENGKAKGGPKRAGKQGAGKTGAGKGGGRKKAQQNQSRKDAAIEKLSTDMGMTPVKSANKALPAAPQMPPVASGARVRVRHILVLISFILCVIAPAAGTYWYLYERAADQYTSSVGFSVRKEESGSASEAIGILSQVSTGSSSDTDILYEFIQSQKLVEQIDAKLDLRAMYSKPQSDPVFAFDDEGSLEDLIIYWNRMTKVFYSGGNGLIQLRVHAFDPTDAKAIAEAIFDESSIMINRLSAIARADATRYATDELDLALVRLKEARQAITTFRNETQIVDPQADLQGQMGLINTLQQQLAEALIKQDLLLETSQASDPRNAQAARTVTVIRDRIEQEREKFSAGNNSEVAAYSTLIARYEGLIVDREFAEKFYLSALSAYDSARADGQRKSRYLAAYVEPTLAQTALYPQRITILALISIFAFLIWSILVLIAYSIKDRR